MFLLFFHNNIKLIVTSKLCLYAHIAALPVSKGYAGGAILKNINKGTLLGTTYNI